MSEPGSKQAAKCECKIYGQSESDQQLVDAGRIRLVMCSFHRNALERLTLPLAKTGELDARKWAQQYLNKREGGDVDDLALMITGIYADGLAAGRAAEWEKVMAAKKSGYDEGYTMGRATSGTQLNIEEARKLARNIISDSPTTEELAVPRDFLVERIANAIVRNQPTALDQTEDLGLVGASNIPWSSVEGAPRLDAFPQFRDNQKVLQTLSEKLQDELEPLPNEGKRFCV